MLISLTTDFGLSDSYVAQMKAVIYSIAPQAQLVDVSHEIPPQDIVIGGVVLASAIGAFPPGTVHLAVVDPGVGSQRAPIAVEAEDCFFIGPDNGLFTLALRQRRMLRAVNLNNPKYHREKVSGTFHGRDIFAPAAAHLASDVRFEELGEPVERIVLAELPQPRIEGKIITAQVMQADRFGNLITNLDRDTYDAWRNGASDRDMRVMVHNTQIPGIRRAFCDAAIGQLLAFFGSSDHLEIAVRDGSAARTLAAGRASEVLVRRV